MKADVTGIDYAPGSLRTACSNRQRAHYNSELRAYEDLANGIIAQACKDLYQLVKYGSDICTGTNNYKSLYNFFHGEWFEVLSDMDGSYLFDKVVEIVKSGEKMHISTITKRGSDNGVR